MRPEHWLYTIALRPRSLFRWAQMDKELDDELRDLERKTEGPNGGNQPRREWLPRFPKKGRTGRERTAKNEEWHYKTIQPQPSELDVITARLRCGRESCLS
jgi:hypothetical protein